MATYFSLLASFLILSLFNNLTKAQLDPDYYNELCPQALPTIKMVVEQAIPREPRMGASLLRLHFHDCFVNGCDGSILLDDTPTFVGEKAATPNNNSVRGFEVVDEIKAAVNSACGNVVSCADILAVAARDSVAALGGASYAVEVGRKDSTTASMTAADNNIPTPSSDFQALLSNFESHGLSLKDLVVLSGAHTIGQARCASFRAHVYNDAAVNSRFARKIRADCPLLSGDDDLSPLDGSPERFDNVYFKRLVRRMGLLHSDQELFKGDGSASDGLVKQYEGDVGALWEDFGVSMLRMGRMSPLMGNDGEIRKNCRRPN